MEPKNIKVLVTDDEDDFRYLLRYWLQARGYSVIMASSGEEAIKFTREQNPDIIFMDLRMPAMDGVQTIGKIREFNRDVPVIIISAYLEDLKIKEANNYGISGVFYKGKDFQQSMPLIESALRTHKKLKKPDPNPNQNV